MWHFHDEAEHPTVDWTEMKVWQLRWLTLLNVSYPNVTLYQNILVDLLQSANYYYPAFSFHPLY